MGSEWRYLSAVRGQEASGRERRQAVWSGSAVAGTAILNICRGIDRRADRIVRLALCRYVYGGWEEALLGNAIRGICKAYVLAQPIQLGESR